MVDVPVAASFAKGRPPVPAVTEPSPGGNTATLALTPAGGAVGDRLDLELATEFTFTAPIHTHQVAATSGILLSGTSYTTPSLVDGPYFARLRQSRLHPNGQRVYSGWSPILAITIAAGEADPAPAVADVTIPLGRATKALVNFATLVSTGGPITGEGVGNSLSGTNSTHFGIAADGTLYTTSAFVSSPQTGYTLTATVSNAAGSDTLVITIPTEANAADASTIAEIKTAVAAAKTAGATGTHKVYCRPGDYGDFATGCQFIGSSYSFSGTFAQANQGLTDETGYDRDAEATITGGSVTITCRTPKGARFLGQMSITGCRGFILDDLLLARRFETQPGNKGDGAASYALVITRNATHNTRPMAIIRNCQIGSWFTADDVRLSISGIKASIGDELAVEDCEFDGVYNALAIGGFNEAYILRNSVRRLIQDGLPMRGINDATVDPVIRHITDFTMFDPVEGIAFFQGLHNDALQFGTWGDMKEVQFFCGWSYFIRCSQGGYVDDCAGPWTLGEVIPVSNSRVHNGHFWSRTGGNTTAVNTAAGSAAGEPGVGADWQLYWIDMGATPHDKIEVRGRFHRVFALIIAYWGLTGHHGAVTFSKSVVLSDPFRSDAGLRAYISAFKGSSHAAEDCITNQLFTSSGASFASTTNCLEITKTDQHTVFQGTFTQQDGSAPEPVLDLTTAATARASVDAAWLPILAHASKGHLAA